MFTGDGRADLVAEEQAELAVIQYYLPQQMDEAAIRLVAQAIEAVPECDGATLLRAIVRSESARLVPDDTVRVVALAA